MPCWPATTTAAPIFATSSDTGISAWAPSKRSTEKWSPSTESFIRIRCDSIATPVDPDQRTPFAAVTWFRADDAFHVSDTTSCSDLQRLLEKRFPSTGVPYAIKVTGRFTSLTTRSEPAQEKPYPPLATALQHQVVFNFANVDAVLAGFWLPSFLSDLNVAGFHFHAILADRMTGGHVLDCVVENANVEIDTTSDLEVQLGDGETRRPLVPAPGHGTEEQRERPPLSRW